MPLMSEVKQTGKRGERIGTFLSWMLAVLACLWVAWCCAIGPLYWFGDGLSDFGWLNVLYLVVAFAIWFSIVVALVRFGRGRRVLPQYFARRHEKLCNEIAGTPTTVLGIMLRHLHDAAHSRPGRALHAVIVWTGRKLIRCTDCWWKLMLVFVIGWLWIPTTLLAAFGADIRSQIREFSWALNQWTGLKQPYIGFFSFVPMDIYPTAHYMWPDNPTYLTDQHNVVLTVFYGAAAAVRATSPTPTMRASWCSQPCNGYSPHSAVRPPPTGSSTCRGAGLASARSTSRIRNATIAGICAITRILKQALWHAPPDCGPVRKHDS